MWICSSTFLYFRQIFPRKFYEFKNLFDYKPLNLLNKSFHITAELIPCTSQTKIKHYAIAAQKLWRPLKYSSHFASLETITIGSWSVDIAARSRLSCDSTISPSNFKRAMWACYDLTAREITSSLYNLKWARINQSTLLLLKK